MLMVISPAKTLDYESPLATETFTKPDFLDDACELIDQLKELEPHQVSNLMSISDKLGQLNAERFQSWHTPFSAKNARQAVLAFKGDVYTGLGAESFGEQDFSFAQAHLRMLSGLYGILKPLDLMQPYRLEMGTKFENKRGKDLYAFWGDRLTQEINRLLKNDDGVLVNLASNEYFKSLKKKDIEGQLITPQFKDWKNGQYKIISFYAKKARGLMCRYAILNRITNANDLKGFNLDGYYFSEDQSDKNNWVFLRDEH
ncbi:peroxide stress protein YaaA [Marinobacter sp.]|uniref:peroxide stress protein YaaA n=1 Tax=Marinobacter sp. TaxID=50741 RepID=UPI001B671136|nr:peroxide stress protein YaaA [Marinobacter sp.]MBQ0834017.1 peroxide stress protein YaaA [Marinobacter sp.]